MAFISRPEQIETVKGFAAGAGRAADNRELLDSLFRCAHTVKGSAGILA